MSAGRLLPGSELVALRDQVSGPWVFTNGCFDLLHVGHTRYLAQARALGNCLVVGLNSDRSVRQLKGPERPLVPEQERAEVLCSLRAVDYVVIFDDPTADRLLALLRPEIYVKGGDYAPQTVPEGATVRAYGGQIQVLPFHPGHSTTQLARKMQASPRP